MQFSSRVIFHFDIELQLVVRFEHFYFTNKHWVKSAKSCSVHSMNVYSVYTSWSNKIIYMYISKVHIMSPGMGGISFRAHVLETNSNFKFYFSFSQSMLFSSSTIRLFFIGINRSTAVQIFFFPSQAIYVVNVFIGSSCVFIVAFFLLCYWLLLATIYCFAIITRVSNEWIVDVVSISTGLPPVSWFVFPHVFFFISFLVNFSQITKLYSRFRLQF